jgi:hypothetical protein
VVELVETDTTFVDVIGAIIVAVGGVVAVVVDVPPLVVTVVLGVNPIGVPMKLKSGARLGHTVDAQVLGVIEFAPKVQFETNPSTLALSVVTVPEVSQTTGATEAVLLQMHVSVRFRLLASRFKTTTPIPPSCFPPSCFP